MSVGAVLLDTCAAIWFANGDPLADAAGRAIREAVAADGAFVSPVTGWEVGLIAYWTGSARGLPFLPNPLTWFARLMAKPGVEPAELTWAIGIAASMLPGDFHKDPADRLLVATARDRGVPIVTRDHKILDYAKAGHVTAIAC